MTTTKPTIGFIGLGIMGAPMASNLLAAGYASTVLEDLADNRVAEAVEG
jgi:3-hydroxyisobutyrate dehydrogenase-like beta-hydroxyacid dehydrogenase